MLEIFSAILKAVFIVFFFGFCVFIHEFGHLLVALWQGLHVEKFSIGMGPKLWGFNYKGVEYVISWLPFGGYVSLPQLDPTDSPVTSDDKPLPPAGPKARALTAFAGPAFNVLFGFVLATVMWGVGLWRPTPSSSVMVAGVPAYIPTSGGVAEDVRVFGVDGVAFAEGGDMTWADFCYEGVNVAFGDRIAKGELPEEFTLTIREKKDAELKEVLVRPTINQEWLTGGLRAGDCITKVNGKSFTNGTAEFQQEYVYGNTGHVTLEVLRDGVSREVSYQPQKNSMMEDLGFPFFEVVNPVQFADVSEGSIADKAGIRSGDQLISFAGKNVVGPRDFVGALPGYAGKSAQVVVARDGKELRELVLDIPVKDCITEADLGISFYVLVTSVVEDSPAARAGIQYGDRFVKLAKADAPSEVVSVQDVQGFQKYIRSSEGVPLLVTYLRGGKELTTTTITPYENPSAPGSYVIGVVITNGLTKTIQHVDPWTQFSEVVSTTTRTLGLLFAPITSRAKSMVTGKARETSQTQIGVKHMSGPLGIIMALWYKLKIEGLRGGFSFIILITFSLAFMNLLPLPVLDGGHIVFAAIEGITRRRIPVTFFKYIYNTFAILLIALMLYITLFDGRRILKRTGVIDSTEKTTAPEVQK